MNEYLNYLLSVIFEIIKLEFTVIAVLKTPLKKNIVRWGMAVVIIFLLPLTHSYLDKGIMLLACGITFVYLTLDHSDLIWKYLFSTLLIQLSDNMVRIAEIGLSGKYIDSGKAVSSRLMVESRNLLVYALLCMAIILLLKKYNVSEMMIDLKSYIFLIITGLIILFCLTGSGLILAGEANNRIKSVYAVSTGFLILFVMLMLLFQGYLKDLGERYKNMAVEQKEDYEQRLDFYIEKKDSYDELRNFKHDLNEHISAVKGYLRCGEYIKMERELDKFTEITINIDKMPDCGNVALSALLSHYSFLSEKNNIVFSSVGKIYGEINAEDYELVTIVGNLLKNAFEECLKLKDNRKIETKIYCDDEECMITVSNSTDKDDLIAYKPTVLKTTKKDRTKHGIGMKNIERVLRYNKNISVDMRILDNFFISTVIIKKV